MIIQKLFFLVFWHPQEVPDLAKSSQNAARVCKNKGYHLFKKSSTFLQKPIKNGIPLDPQRPPKIEKVLEKTFPKPTSKKHEKKGTRMKKKSANVTQRHPPPSPLPQQSHPGAPPEQSLS